MRSSVAIPVLILVVATSAACADEPCLSSKRNLTAGSVANTNMFVSASCKLRSPIPAFYYDRSDHVIRLSRDVEASEVVRPFPGYGRLSVEPGDDLTLVIDVGTVRVARHVVALQEAHAGQRLFVKSRDGQILAARFEPGAP